MSLSGSNLCPCTRNPAHAALPMTTLSISWPPAATPTHDGQETSSLRPTHDGGRQLTGAGATSRNVLFLLRDPPLYVNDHFQPVCAALGLAALRSVDMAARLLAAARGGSVDLARELLDADVDVCNVAEPNTGGL